MRDFSGTCWSDGLRVFQVGAPTSTFPRGYTALRYTTYGGPFEFAVSGRDLERFAARGEYWEVPAVQYALTALEGKVRE